MAKPFLRSGKRSDYLALGENGQTVFDSALQIRESLRLRGLDAVANCLAIPQSHNDDDSIDWYAPFNGKLTAWSAMSNSGRLEALEYLQQRRSELDVVREQCIHTDNLALKLFSLLLKHVLQFPSVQYIWLLNDKPIIAFWGFSAATQLSNVQMLDVLLNDEKVQAERVEEPDIKPADIDKVTEVKNHHAKTLLAAYEPEDIVTLSESDPEATPAVVISSVSQNVEAEPVEPVTPKKRRSFAKKLQCFSLAAIVVAIGAAIALPLFYSSSSAPIQPQNTTSHVERQNRIDLPLEHKIKLTSQPEFVSTLPVQMATVVAPPEPVQVISEPEKDTLVLFPNSIKAGSIKFLNGSWQAKFSGKQASSLPAIRLQIINGKGDIRLTQNNKVCQAKIQAGLLPSGTLSINSRTRARCGDGSLLTVPKITCKPGDNAVAICQAQWATDESAQLTFKKIDG